MNTGRGSDATDAMDPVFRALADVNRRGLLDSLNAHNGQSLRELCAGQTMARQSVSKHLAILAEAGLVTTVWHGREKLHYLNAVPINDIADRWMTHFDRARARALSDLKRVLEGELMEKPAFVYTIYIHTIPEQLWKALTDPAFTRRYWGTSFQTDWQAGSPMTWEYNAVTIADPEQVVLESNPYRRLSYTWQTITADFAQSVGFSPEYFEKVAKEPRSKVSFEIEPLGQQVKLTVIHDGFEPGSTVLESISGGWPVILSSLKTLLETGNTLPESSQSTARRTREGTPPPSA